ncbi:MAG TPA: 3-hydroxyacyl-CoA dehydrogenase [Geminicoccaceae bacterium]|nr:3-hydroxyacyl-CoA dehydrogenase [Geminicoccaceae bacterium]
MAFDPASPALILGVVGAGTMGRGIAQIAAAAGIDVRLTDARVGAADEARAFIAKMVERQVEKGLAADARAIERLQITDSAGLAPCDLVVEAIVEDLSAKRRLFADLEQVVRADAVLATNTSSLSVSAIAAACARPERVAGWHFFNPVPLMKLVEVVPGQHTAEAVVEALQALALRMGHRPVRATDSPGFLVNHAGRGYGTEALRILAEGVASPVEIDRILREAAGFRMGPFELFDLVGIDVTHAVMESIYRQFYDEPRFRPQPLLRRYVDAGLLGRKSGAGFYRYLGGRQEIPAEAPPPAAAQRPIWIGADEEDRPALRQLLAAGGSPLDDAKTPGQDSVCLVAALGSDATHAALAQGLDARRTVAIDPLFGFAGRLTLMVTPVTGRAALDGAHAALAASRPVSVIRDSVGFVAQRVAAHIVNIGCDIAQQRIASAADIDAAVRLGLGYPKGPLELGDALGAGKILAILRGLQDAYGDPRYRPSPWLERRAALGVSLTADDP